MCGICGFVLDGPPPSDAPDWLGQMQAQLHHRGPDESGRFGPLQFSSQPPRTIALGHARLSIIDLTTGQQPMSNDDGSVQVVANAEIYNFRSLRAELQQHGHRFRTSSDIETIVHLYEEAGEGCFERLRGMFAIGLWDGKQNKLLLARDRVGKKPLCYALADGRLAFASEIRSLLEYPGVGRELDIVALDHYLTYQYVPAPMSIFKAIRKVPPGHFLRWQDGHIDVKPYWRLQPRYDAKLSEQECIERIRAILGEATDLRMVADVPVGAFLSGGVDSSIIVGLMSQRSDRPVKTFSIGFDHAKFNELPYARIVAEHFKTEHREFVVQPNAMDVLPELIMRYGEPFADCSAIPTYYVAKMTRQHVKVTLNGDGGDESFAGYLRYKAVKLAGKFDVLPSAVRRAVAALAQGMPVPFASRSVRRVARRFLSLLPYSPQERYLRIISYFEPEAKELLYTDEAKDRLREAGAEAHGFLLGAFERFAGAQPVNQAALVDIVSYLPYDLLVKMDIATMANSLEARSPFLDQELVSFAAEIPAALKLRGYESKYILKQAFKDLLPREILHRGKMGFGVPVAQWLRGQLSGYLRDTLLSDRATRRGYFRPERVQEMVERHCAGRENFADELWALLCFELWAQAFLDGQ